MLAATFSAALAKKDLGIFFLLPFSSTFVKHEYQIISRRLELGSCCVPGVSHNARWKAGQLLPTIVRRG